MTGEPRTPRMRPGPEPHRDQQPEAGTQPPSSLLQRVVARIERHVLPPVNRERSLRTQALFLIIVLILAALAARAQADMLHLGEVEHINGGVSVRAVARAPAETDYAAGLYPPGECPPTPAETDAYTAVNEHATVLYVWPLNGETGRLELCVWLWHDNATVGARSHRPVVISAGQNSARSLAPLVLSHPALWLVIVGWLASFVLPVLPISVLAASAFGFWIVCRRLRQRHARRGGRRQRRREDENLDRLRGRANTDSRPADGAEQATVEFDAVGSDVGAIATESDTEYGETGDPAAGAGPGAPNAEVTAAADADREARGPDDLGAGDV